MNFFYFLLSELLNTHKVHTVKKFLGEKLKLEGTDKQFFISTSPFF